MIGAGIRGDLLVVDRSLNPRPGRIVVAILDGAFIKQLMPSTRAAPGSRNPACPVWIVLQMCRSGA